jgi:heat shock protein HslJ
MKRILGSSIFAALAAIGALAAGLVAVPLALAAQEATPAPVPPEIGPILWQLRAIENPDGSTTPVDTPARYTVQFLPDGRVAIGADCNRGAGDYTISGSELSFGAIATTRAFCPEGSLSDQFLQALDQVASYSIDQSQATDQLVLGLEEGGALWFSPALTGVVWQWEQFEGGDGAVVAPDVPSRYALQFNDDGSINGTIDCNVAGGSYESDGASISIVMLSTLIFCGEESLDAEFNRFVTESTSFVIRDGKLHLALPMDGGITSFTAHFPAPAANGTPEAGTPQPATPQPGTPETGS